VVFSDQEVRITIDNIDSQKQVDALVDEVYKGLQRFTYFNENNLARARLIEPSEAQIKANEKLRDRRFVGFLSNSPLMRNLMGVVSGDGPLGEVYVEVFYKTGLTYLSHAPRKTTSKQVWAVTLGNHMIVGVRHWEVFGRLEGKSAVVTVGTTAWEQRSSVATNVGFSLGGRSQIATIWDTYLANIAKAALQGRKGTWEALPAIWRQRIIRAVPSTPERGTQTPDNPYQNRVP
jgi:hypothetical protein